MPSITHNERSRGIQLISKINVYLSCRSFFIKSSGGEIGLKHDGKTLFPDVYLYGGEEINNILQGWELKLPDTNINDEDLINNATIKAEKLGLNSFIVRNFSVAVLYIKEGNKFIPKKEWDNLSNVTSRGEAIRIISEEPKLWTEMAHEIIDDLNDFFTEGTLEGRSLVETVDLNSIVDTIFNISTSFKTYLKNIASVDTIVNGEIELWWTENKASYLEQAKQSEAKRNILSKVIVINRINKITYAHILKKYYNEARIIESFSDIDSVEDADHIFNQISISCDFWNIFKSYSINTRNLNLDLCIPDEILNALKEFNSFLSGFDIYNIDSSTIESFLIQTIQQNKRKLAGQFTTPEPLAKILVKSVIDDKNKIVYDGCCGTGTIIKEVYNYKAETLGDNIAINTLLASDKFSFPIQISNINLSNPENIGRVLQLFKEDIFKIKKGYTFSVYDANTGEEIKKVFPMVDVLLSNLPFIQQEDFEKFNPGVRNSIKEFIISQYGQEFTLDGRSDLYAYIIIHLSSIVINGGTLGIIISNSWLASNWGKKFRIILLKYFTLEKVIISGNGKWFKNADVVTNIIILKRKVDENTVQNKISFITLKDSIYNMNDDMIDEISVNILLNRDSPFYYKNEYSLNEISNIETYNLGWNALFADVNFINRFSSILSDLSSFFEINRGEKTGCDSFFYLQDSSVVDPEYVIKTLKTTRGLTRYTIIPNTNTFICSDSIDNLTDSGKTLTIKWIDRHQGCKDSINKKFIEWYDFPRNIEVDFVINVNPNKVIAVYELNKRCYVGQRGIGLQIHEGLNKNLLFALMNSIISLFFIEAAGFGRGLGALDLNSDKIKNLKILDPSLLNAEQMTGIIEKFNALKQREIKELDEELVSSDRVEFDKYVLECYGVLDYYENVKSALLQMYNTRISVE